MASMKNIMAGLDILSKYVNPSKETLHAEHDELYVPGSHPDDMLIDEVSKLYELGFLWDGDTESWKVFTYYY